VITPVATIVLFSHRVANSPEIGGHFWVYAQYVLGLMRAGCDVYWLDWFMSHDPERDRAELALFSRRVEQLGFGGRAIVVMAPRKRAPIRACAFAGALSARAAEAVFRRADLLLNFHYAADPELVARFRRTALVDIDPGLLQHWMSSGQLEVAAHDVWFTTGETVGLPGSRIPDCGKEWNHIRPCVSLQEWPVAYEAAPAPMTTVSSWDAGEWTNDDDGRFHENNKRVTFLQFRELPRHVDQPLELAVFSRPEDESELDTLRRAGWNIRHAREVASSPETYRAFIQRSRAEFSCAKPAYVRFRDAWVSDRTVCYLASGKPAVVQDTGPSAYLPNGDGLFRFSTTEEATSAIAAVNDEYPRHCRAARALAEEYFDARRVTERILEVALAARAPSNRGA
jgi:hypothetical protein